jgi:hypothetical protein
MLAGRLPEANLVPCNYRRLMGHNVARYHVYLAQQMG